MYNQCEGFTTIPWQPPVVICKLIWITLGLDVTGLVLDPNNLTPISGTRWLDSWNPPGIMTLPSLILSTLPIKNISAGVCTHLVGKLVICYSLKDDDIRVWDTRLWQSHNHAQHEINSPLTCPEQPIPW